MYHIFFQNTWQLTKFKKRIILFFKNGISGKILAYRLMPTTFIYYLMANLQNLSGTQTINTNFQEIQQEDNLLNKHDFII
ncbi:hypothetical protein BpHYR1_002273 [Brachionus plicatilis]|uniref:Uncharacterized protein n=1 Tax=Brachionus plicatilis TaxID=10195 RepID=A0A3M7PML9_BRAPC|nr:hypothetical protein BpHYR1_002273 [Brachionus plicatilis]